MKPVIPKAWGNFGGQNNKTYAVLSVLAYMLGGICGSEQWTQELEELLSEYNDILADKLGFFDGWKESDPWARLMWANTGTDGFAQ